MNTSDVYNSDATALIDQLNAQSVEVLAPAIYLWEMDAYLKHPEKAKSHTQSSGSFSLSVIDVTSGLYFRTHSSAMVCVSGADRVFISLAKDQDAPLITNDKQILANASSFGVKAVSIAGFLAGEL